MLALRFLFAVTFIALTYSSVVFAWSPRQSLIRLPSRVTLCGDNSLQSSNDGSVQAIRLDALGDNHEDVGTAMGTSVRRWLDAEWMPQKIHAQIGDSCAASYVTCRREKETDDIMTIMTQVADDLTEVWYEKFDQDAFVNPWDIANYVSDYLTKQSGNEGCECSATIH